MRIYEVFLICLVSICFGEETHNQTKNKTEQDDLLRWKRAKIRPNDNQSLLRPDKINLNDNHLLPNLRHGLPKKIEPITNLKRVNAKANISPILPSIKQTLRLPTAHITLPLPKTVNIQKNIDIPVLKVHNNEEKEDYFIDKGDAEEIKIEEKHENLLTASKRVMPIDEDKIELHSSITPVHELLFEHKAEPQNKEVQSESEVKTEVNGASSTEKNIEHDVKLPKEKLANKDMNTHDEDTLKDIIKQLPQIIQSLLATKKSVGSPLFIIHNFNADSTADLTRHNLSRNGEALKLVLKPILEKKETDLDVDDLTEICWKNNIQNETINSIQILHKNYTEVIEKTHDCEKTHHIPEHIDHRDHVVNENIADHTPITANHHLHVSSTSPLNNTLHETVHHNCSYHNHNDILDESTHHRHLHNLVPDLSHHYHYTPDQTYTKPPFEYPIQQNIKTYAFKANDNGQLKSGSVIDDNGRNTTWKTWTNTEVVIKTGNNKHTDEELEVNKSQQTPSFSNQWNLVAPYKDLYHNVKLPGRNNIYRYNSPPLLYTPNQASPSYITYYPDQNKDYTFKNYEDSNIESCFDSHAV